MGTCDLYTLETCDVVVLRGTHRFLFGFDQKVFYPKQDRSKPTLRAAVAFEGFAEDRLLQLVASLERPSEHPLAAALVHGAEEKKLLLLESQNFASVTGKGVHGTVEGMRIAVGSEVLFQELSIDPATLLAQAERMRGEGPTVMLVASDGRAAGLVALADAIKSSSAEAVRELKAAGLSLVMVTGDNATTARSVADTLGIEFKADVLPAGKGKIPLCTAF